MSQEAEILNYIKRNGSITPLEALTEIGCFRLAARIYDLRFKGHKIQVERAESNGKLFASYYLG